MARRWNSCWHSSLSSSLRYGTAAVVLRPAPSVCCLRQQTNAVTNPNPQTSVERLLADNTYRKENKVPVAVRKYFAFESILSSYSPLCWCHLTLAYAFHRLTAFALINDLSQFHDSTRIQPDLLDLNLQQGLMALEMTTCRRGGNLFTINIWANTPCNRIYFRIINFQSIHSYFITCMTTYAVPC